MLWCHWWLIISIPFGIHQTWCQNPNRFFFNKMPIKQAISKLFPKNFCEAKLTQRKMGPIWHYSFHKYNLGCVRPMSNQLILCEIYTTQYVWFAYNISPIKWISTCVRKPQQTCRNWWDWKQYHNKTIIFTYTKNVQLLENTTSIIPILEFSTCVGML